MSGPKLFIPCSALLLIVSTVHAGPGQLSMSSQIQYPTVIQGFQDPVDAYIFNQAAPGSDPVNYSVFATFPYGSSPFPPYSGSRAADGGSGYVILPFSFNSGLVSPGSQSVSVTATDTGTGGSLTQFGSVTVLAHAVPAFNIGGNVVQLPPQPVVAMEPPVDPLAFAATGGGESFAGAAPNVIGDPIAPTAGLNLDSITAFGDSQITLSLTPFTDLPANDNPAFGHPFQIQVDGSVPGVYFTDFELNYSDEQDLPGADATGSEHGYFGVEVTVTAGGVTGAIVIPEPGSCRLIVLGLVPLFLLVRSRSRFAK